MRERIREMLHARERLMLDLSHELRSPLTRLKLALEFLPDDPARDSIRQDIAEMEAWPGRFWIIRASDISRENSSASRWISRR